MAALTYRVGAPAPLVPLTSLENFKSDLKISDTSQDDDLKRYLLGASSAVLGFINRSIIVAAWRDIIEVTPDCQRLYLVLGRFPLKAITAFSVNGTLLDAPTVESLNIDSANGTIYPPDGGPSCLWQPGRYVITYTAGYDPPDDKGGGTVPYDVQQAVLIAAAARYHAAARDPNLRQESEQGVGSTSFSSVPGGTGGLPQQAADLVARYRGGGIR